MPVPVPLSPRLPLIVQRLRDGAALADLVAAHHLFVGHHGPWVQLCYHSTRSPTDSALAGECRGLILRPDQAWRPVCWGMDRFFNHHEDQAPPVPPLRAEEKEDGTYILLFCDDGGWHAATRHTFCAVDERYLRLMLAATGCASLDDLAARAALDPGVTWCLEICAPDNRIIRAYPTPRLFLLAAYRLDDHTPLPDAALDAVAARSDGAIGRPRVHGRVESIADAQALLDAAVAREPMFEGLVLRDAAGTRLKLKSARYRELDRLKFQGWAAASPRMLAPFLLQPDQGAGLLAMLEGLLSAESLAEVAWRVARYGAVIQAAEDRLAALWTAVQGLPRREAAQRLLADDAPPSARLLLRRWEVLQQDPAPSWAALLRDEGERALRPLFGEDFTSPLALALAGHGPQRCPPPQSVAPGTGIAARVPVAQADGIWQVWCACGVPMVRIRLKVARVQYLECHCGGRVGLHSYPAATLLWLCGACGCTHEAHQDTQSWPDEGIVYARGQPLGIPADRACKALRLQVHEEMAALRGAHGWSKSQTYQWLATVLQLPRPRAHVALFDVPTCTEAIIACQTALCA